jgi:hypothetical protein
LNKAEKIHKEEKRFIRKLNESVSVTTTEEANSQPSTDEVPHGSVYYGIAKLDV